MKVIAINGSPKGRASSTDKMLTPLLAGMRGAGAETETIYLVEKTIHYCRGCFACWVKTPGKCVIQDDMASLIEKLIQSDLMILATPLYIYSMTGLMKNFLDRLIPLLLPWLEESKSDPRVTSHPRRYEKPSKMLLVSGAGFPEFCHFDALVMTMKEFAKAGGSDYIGEILRPEAPLLQVDHLVLKLLLRSYYSKLEKAGKEIVTLGKISDEVQAALRKDLMPGGAVAYRKRANQAFEKQLSENQ